MARQLEYAGEPNGRIFAVAAWREAPYCSDAERAALALTAAATRLADRPDPVPDDTTLRRSPGTVGQSPEESPSRFSSTASDNAANASSWRGLTASKKTRRT